MSNERPQLNDKIGPKILSDGADAGLHGPSASLEFVRTRAARDHHSSSALAQNSPHSIRTPSNPQISTRSQTDTKSTLTDTRSNSRETDSRKRTDICQATPTDRSPPVSLTTPAAKGSSAPAPSSLPPPSGAPPAPSPASVWLVLPIRPPPGVLKLRCVVLYVL